MTANALLEVKKAFALAWRLKLPFAVSHLVFNILLAAVFAPLMTLTVTIALKFSGQPALADFDIALFLLSPIGFVAGLVLVGLALVLFVLDVAFMMAVALRDRTSGAHGVWDGVALVLPRAHAVLTLAVHLSLRMLLLCLPFLLVAAAIYKKWLTTYDINYYLAQHPPEFIMAVLLIGGVLAAMTAVLIWRMSGWALALPLVLFGGRNAAQSLRESRAQMRGTHIRFVLKMMVWFAVSAAIVAGPLGAVAVLMQATLGWLSVGLEGLAAYLLVSTALWAALNLFVTALTTGALAVLLMARAGWPNTHVVAWTGKGGAGLRWLVAGAVAVAAFGAFELVDAAAVDSQQPVAVIAHRGAAGARPENTMAAINKAVEVGTDWVEIDVQETADGAVVVIHDSDFMKLAGVPTKIWDANLQDLAEIDIGSWFDPQYSDQRTPLLSEVLAATKDKAGVVIELKYYGHDEQLEARVAEIVEAADMVDQVKIMSLKYEAVQKMRALRPDWDIGLLASASLGRMWELDADFLAVNSAAASHKLVRETRNAGKKLYVWTVNDPLTMSGMISLGVDGLITDEPELARQVLAQRRELNGLERLVLGLAGRIGLDLEGLDDDSS